MRGRTRAHTRKGLGEPQWFAVGKIGERVEEILPAEEAREEVEDVLDVHIHAGLQAVPAPRVAYIIDKLVALLSGVARAEIVAAQQGYSATLVDRQFRSVGISSARLSITRVLKPEFVHHRL